MSGPELDTEKLSEALNGQGLLLEAEAFFVCRGRAWSAVHGFRYGESPDTREIDVLGSKEIPFTFDLSKRKASGRVFVPIECKHATRWWVFVDLSKSTPDPHEFLFHTGKRTSATGKILEGVMPAVIEEASALPDRAFSSRELSFSYDKVKNEQFYPAFRQVQSAMSGLMDTWRGFSRSHPFLGLVAPVVMTSRPLIVARAQEGDSEFEFQESDWVIAGPPPTEMVHVVTTTGLKQLLALLDDAINKLRKKETWQHIATLVDSNQL